MRFLFFQQLNFSPISYCHLYSFLMLNKHIIEQIISIFSGVVFLIVIFISITSVLTNRYYQSLLPLRSFHVSAVTFFNEMMMIIVIIFTHFLLTFTTCRLTLFIYTAAMIGTVTLSFFSTIFISLHFSTQMTERVKEREEKEMNDRMTKECQSSKKDIFTYTAINVYINIYMYDVGFSLACILIERVYLDRQCRLARNMIDFQTTYMQDRRLSLCIHKGDVHSYDSTVASVIENDFSFFFLFYTVISDREKNAVCLFAFD